jgi:hypothetical protein
MKNIIILLTAIFSFQFAYAIPDPGIRDTVRVDSVTAYPGGTAVLPVYFYNDEPLSMAEIVLKHDTSYLVLDSFTMAGGRLSYIPDSTVYFRNLGSLLDLSVFDYNESIAVGNGMLCKLYFTTKLAAAGHTIVIDSGFLPPVSRTMFSDSTAENSIYPHIKKGFITVQDAAPAFDSVWVDTVTGSPGQTVEVKIYGKNEDNISAINLALAYSSGNLIYKSVMFDNTRGASAGSKIVSPNNQDRQLLINLNYGNSTPLTPGRGPLAIITFEIASGTPDETVIIDSASYLGIQRLEFLNISGISFAPFFIAGFVEVINNTALDDDEEVLLPNQFALGQNYPNPFNPSTIIHFELPKVSTITLDVFNILGQKVRTLIDRQLPAGIYNVTFDGRGDDRRPLASGVYLYRLTAENYSRSRAMMLLK